MTVTLDGKTLNVVSMDESYDAVSTQWHGWEDETYKRKVNVRGKLQGWLLNCYEKGVTWANSQIKHFREKLDAGDPVTLVITEAGDTIFNGSVYILGVTMRYEQGRAESQRYREFALILQEA